MAQAKSFRLFLFQRTVTPHYIQILSTLCREFNRKLKDQTDIWFLLMEEEHWVDRSSQGIRFQFASSLLSGEGVRKTEHTLWTRGR